MARGPWAKVAARGHLKYWYEPLSDPEDALLGLRFTLSHVATAAIPPGDETLLRVALGVALRFTPLSAAESQSIYAGAHVS